MLEIGDVGETEACARLPHGGSTRHLEMPFLTATVELTRTMESSHRVPCAGFPRFRFRPGIVRELNGEVSSRWRTDRQVSMTVSLI